MLYVSFLTTAKLLQELSLHGDMVTCVPHLIIVLVVDVPQARPNAGNTDGTSPMGDRGGGGRSIAGAVSLVTG